MKYKLKNNQGITLIALVITIAVIVIIAGIIVAITLQDSGIFDRAKQAKEDFLTAQNQEDIELAKSGTVIDEMMSSRDTVTISKEQYDQLINNQIKYCEPKLLVTTKMASATRSAGTYKASSATYTKTNSEDFDNYLSYEEGIGWRVKKSGLYMFNMYQNLAYSSAGNANTNYYINSNAISVMSKWIDTSMVAGTDSDTVTVYLKEGSIIDFAVSTRATFKNVYGEQSIYAMTE